VATGDTGPGPDGEPVVDLTGEAEEQRPAVPTGRPSFFRRQSVAGVGQPLAGDPRTGDQPDPVRRLRAAFRSGTWLAFDPGLPDGDRVLDADLVAKVLLAGAAGTSGAVPRLRVRGAVIRGRLDLSFATVAAPVEFRECRWEGVPDLTGAYLRSISLIECELPGLDGRLLSVEGDLRILRCIVSGRLMVENCRVTGAVHLSGSRVSNPAGRAVAAGGMEIGAGLVARDGFRARGTVRIIGARVAGGVQLQGADLTDPGGVALCADELVTSSLRCSDGFRADGELQVRNAEISGEMTVRRSHLHGPRVAIRARGLSAGELRLAPDSVLGLIDLSRARVGALRDGTGGGMDVGMRLDGLTYDHLLVRGSPMPVAQGCAWLARETDRYRPHPYEQLAAYYRRLGHDGDARRVLLMKQRRRRDSRPLPLRICEYLLDWIVGYGYRPWLAGAWMALLVLIGTVVFSAWPPVHVPEQPLRHLDPVVYAVDLLVPVSAFGLQESFEPVGGTRWVADALIVAGWLLATALVAGTSRVLGRN
jgi:hypothetical protein